MSETHWHPMLKLQIGKTEKFIGPGCRDLLAQIQRHGSVRPACKAMGLSYSKAWHILNTLEAEAGFPVLMRKPGGRSGGQTILTPEGKQLLARFMAYEKECNEMIEKLFLCHFPKEAGETK